MENFFVTTEFQANAIKNLKEIKQGSQIVEDYQLDFCTWKDLTRYNEIALVGMFRDGLNTSLAYKLVEIGEINEGLILEEQYLKVVKFEKTR